MDPSNGEESNNNTPTNPTGGTSIPYTAIVLCSTGIATADTTITDTANHAGEDHTNQSQSEDYSNQSEAEYHRSQSESGITSPQSVTCNQSDNGTNSIDIVDSQSLTCLTKLVITKIGSPGNSGEYILPSDNINNSFNASSGGPTFMLGDDSSFHVAETFSSISISSRSSWCGDDDQSDVMDFGDTLTSSNANRIGKIIPVPIGKSLKHSGDGPLDSLFRKITKITSSSGNSQVSRSNSTSSINPSSAATHQLATRAGSSNPNSDSLHLPAQTSKSSYTSPVHRPSHNPISTQALILQRRPGNLPQKDPREEQKHLEEYENMLEEQKKRDSEKEKLLRKHYETKWKHEQDVSTMQYLWNKEVIPNWSSSSKDSTKVRDLWWYGVPPSVRTKLWPLAIGNELNITTDLFTLYVDRSAELIKALNLGRREVNGEMKCTENTVDLIRLDVSRTFINLTMFQKGGPFHESLQQLLAIFVCYRPDIGYVQGMNIIAAVLLLYLEIKDAFIAFANVINRPVLISFFRMDEQKMAAFYTVFNRFFATNLPQLYAHFNNMSLTPDIYLLDWILSLFCKTLPLDTSCRIIDLYLRDGDSFIFRAALGILKLYESHLLQLDFVPVAQFLISLPENTSCDKLFSVISSVSLSRRKYDRMCEQAFSTGS